MDGVMHRLKEGSWQGEKNRKVEDTQQTSERWGEIFDFGFHALT